MISSHSLRKTAGLRAWQLLLLFGFLIFTELGTVSANDTEEECENPSKLRLVTLEKLAAKSGMDGSDVWISIVGEVYDVTAGGGFYGPGGDYEMFGGRDASGIFVSEEFTEEEAIRGLDTVPAKDTSNLDHWRSWYEKTEKYPFVGLLIDPRFYDEEGKPVTELLEYRERLVTRKEELEAQRKDREKKKAAKS